MPDTITERHPDFTSVNLEAALLDQYIAGQFHGRTYCHVAVVAQPKGWALGVAVANERGYTGPFKTFDNEAEAREWAQGLNEHINRTDEDVMNIVISTMGGMPYERRRA